jgi:pyruvate/oxaloacetate carboxyltransferase
VKVGDAVKAGDEVAILEAMKMENSITTDYAGTVQQILVGEGDTVQSDATLMIIG